MATSTARRVVPPRLALTPIEALVAVGLRDGLGIRELAEDCPCTIEELIAVVRRLESLGEVELRDARRASVRELSAVVEGEVDDAAWSNAPSTPPRPGDDEDDDDQDAHDRPTPVMGERPTRPSV